MISKEYPNLIKVTCANRMSDDVSSECKGAVSCLMS